MDDISKIRDMIKEHINNRGRNPNYSTSPEDAVVSYKTDRGTSYEMYIKVLDEIQAAYYELYAERVGITPEQWRSLDTQKPKDKEIYDRGRGKRPDGTLEYPMAISIAEPSKVGN